ncbi:MAG TPA: class I SAM-dependent methyltransferase [Gemmatimonadaceae bacterium]|nr:class I SAM-dependent methyltransferase [Gemmatimonadaceae bacterium]
MEQHEAITLIRDAVTSAGGTWADLGAGSGTFTRALASLVGPEGSVYAVDRDANALRSLATARLDPHAAAIHTVVGDFTDTIQLPRLDGMLFANALHFVRYSDQPRVLRHVASQLEDGAPLIIVEYERRDANPYVPYPISFGALGTLAHECGLAAPRLLATKPSRFRGSIYSAVITAGSRAA